MTTLVATTNDDAWQNASGTVAVTGNDLGGLATLNFWAGWRFPVALDQGQPLASALLKAYIYDTAEDDVYGNFYAENVNDAAAFAASSNNISGRTLTPNYTGVGVTGAGVGWFQVDLTSACQDVLNRPAWANGNSMAVIMDCLSGVSLRFRSYRYSSALYAATLTFEYGGGMPIKSIYYARMRRTP